jgi:hypothetical protein
MEEHKRRLNASRRYYYSTPTTTKVSLIRRLSIHILATLPAGLASMVMAYQDLMDGVDYLVEQRIADPNRLGIGGWSNGGFMTEYTIIDLLAFSSRRTTI